MPRDPEREATARDAVCVGREPYVSGALAHRVLRRTPGRHKGRRFMLTVYRCPLCRKFHIGTKGKED